MNLKDSYIHGGTTSSKGVVKDISLTDGSLVITYADTTSANKSISLGDYVLKSGSTMTGDLILYNGGNGAATPALVFRRGTLLGNDSGTNYYDWRIFDSISGQLLVQVNSISASSWNNIAEFNENGLTVTGKIIKDGGTNQQVLLANGDVKSLSDFMLSNDDNITTILAQLKEEIRYYDDIYEYLNNQAIDTVVLGATNAYIDTLTVAGSTTSGSFVKSGGTNQLVLLADGTVALTNDSAVATETSGRVYPVSVDKSGYLAVNVPWTDEKVKLSVTTTANYRGIVLGYNNAENGTIDSTVTNEVYVTNKLVVQPSTGSIVSKGSGTFGGDLTFTHTESPKYITWNGGAYQQRITITDDSTANTAVFTFQQSSNSGSTWSNLFTILDNSNAKLGTNTVYHSGNLPVFWKHSFPYKSYIRKFIARDTALSGYELLEDNTKPIYIKLTTDNLYFTGFVEFVVQGNYDNVSGMTYIQGYCRNLNNFYIDSMIYNGNNLIGIYLKSQNTDVYYLKFRVFAGTYTNDTNKATIEVYSNIQLNSIELIQPSNSDYATVSSYSYISTPSVGIKYNTPSNVAPFTVSSSLLVTNLNADKLDGHEGSYYATASSLSDYLLLSGGTMTGSITFPNATAAYDSEGIKWTLGGKIGEDTYGGLGIYANGTLFLRPGIGTDYTKGIVISRTDATFNGNSLLHAGNKTTTISSSSTDSQIPTALAVYNAINNGFATNDALVYAGTVNGSATSPGTFFPTSALAAGSKGKVWKVAQSGYINGVAVEVGDMIICNSDSAIAVPTSSNYSTINANFDYIQTNLDPTQFVSLVGIQNISGEKTFDVLNVGNLTVTGLAQFTNTINGSINGNAATANLFLNARTLKVNLATTTAQSFNGSANAESIGVSGILPVANGGTGNNAGTIAYTKITGSSTTADMALVSTTTANTLAFKQLGSHAFDSTAYLPLTGGTLTNTGDDILTINRTDGHPRIRFQSNETTVGYIGVNTSNEIKFVTGSFTYTIAHSGNSTSSAVTLDWGTNTNALKIAGAQFNVVLPSNPNVTSHLYAGVQDGTANATSALSDPYLLLVEGSTFGSQVQVKAGTGISVSAVNGVITITNSQPDLNHNTDRYVNAATFGSITDDTGILMTLTRAGSDNNTVTAKISAIASTTGRGLTPKLALSSTNTIATQSSEYVLTYKYGTETTPVWRKLPTNAFKGTASWTSNSADANYPIGFCTTASPTSGNQYDDYYNSIFTFNPSAKALKIDGCTLQYDSTNKCLKFIFTT